MKFSVICVLAAVLGLALAAPQGTREQRQAPQDDSQTQIVRFVNNNAGIDSYHFGYELSDGQIRSEGGALKDFGEGKQAIVVQGAYSFVGPDGQVYWVNYTADENGFHPVIGTGPVGGVKAGDDVGIDPNALKSLLG